MIKAVRSLKYDNKFGIADDLAKMMLAGWGRWGHPIDLIIPVPLYPDREKKRRYNQAELLAKPFAKAINVPMRTDLLGRMRATRSQAEQKSRGERIKNIAGAFGVGGSADCLHNKNILLIDDVCTTGATLSSATLPLLNAGANKVTAYCLARARRKRPAMITPKNQSVSTKQIQFG